MKPSSNGRDNAPLSAWTKRQNRPPCSLLPLSRPDGVVSDWVSENNVVYRVVRLADGQAVWYAKTATLDPLGRL